MRYVILLALALVTGGVSYFFRGDNYWLINNFGPNLSAGFLGTLAVLFFIERAIESKRQQEKARLSAVALRQLRDPLQRLVFVFATMIKASSPRAFAELPKTIEDLFRSENAAELDWFDLDQPRRSGDLSNWSAHLERTINEDKHRLNVVLGRYIHFLEVQLIETVEALMRDPFLAHLLRLRESRDICRRANSEGPTLYGTAEIRAEFFARLFSVNEELKRAGGKGLEVPTSLTRQDMAPQAGSARLAALPARQVWFGYGDPPRMPQQSG